MASFITPPLAHHWATQLANQSEDPMRAVREAVGAFVGGVVFAYVIAGLCWLSARAVLWVFGWST